ncbi:hypothetical protein TherJR_1428 [Thermincola potens JR]|uniref:Uncharacterized protein n=1 Tax=Thermincola potens (strain JR) TaxID=635013 RepID=D5XF64_THEPJ|nr:hypothetical protein TherJR_1428 [Thermincola potens JR]
MLVRRVIIILNIFIMTFLTGGCTGKTEEKALQDAVNNYNRTLKVVLRTGDVSLLNNVALENEVRRMELFLTYMNEEKKVLSAELDSIKFISAKVDNDQGKAVADESPNKGNEQAKQAAPAKNQPAKEPTAQVKTEEIWTYEYLHPETGAKIEGPFLIKYHTTYKLIKRDKWKVYEVSFKEQVLKR